MKRESFGNSGASLFKLENCNRVTLTLTDIGASIVGLTVPVEGNSELDIVLGYDDPEAYFQCKSYFGVTVGRYASRIGGGVFKLGDTVYELDKNDNGNTLHSGSKPYSTRLWEIVESLTNNPSGLNNGDDSITFRLLSPDGDQGFPGSAEINVKYTLSPDDEVIIEYNAAADKTTLFNLTNHAYFNLGGHGTGAAAILNHKLMLDSEGYTETDKALISTGRIIPVEGTPMDFRQGKRIGQDIEANYSALEMASGYDHNFVIKTRSLDKPIARLWYEDTGLELQTFTDMPGVQFYSGNHMTQEVGKGGVIYDFRGALCLETQFYPNTPNIPEFPGCVYLPGNPFVSTTVYKIVKIL
jgi:aldose 1-epimerase